MARGCHFSPELLVPEAKQTGSSFCLHTGSSPPSVHRIPLRDFRGASCSQTEGGCISSVPEVTGLSQSLEPGFGGTDGSQRLGLSFPFILHERETNEQTQGWAPGPRGLGLGRDFQPFSSPDACELRAEILPQTKKYVFFANPAKKISLILIHPHRTAIVGLAAVTVIGQSEGEEVRALAQALASPVLQRYGAG